MAQLPNLTNTKAEVLVNVWGSKDILKDVGVSGYRQDLLGFTPQGQVGSDGKPTKQLFNIEILGATHFDYMKRGASADPNYIPPGETKADRDWNVTVSQFVTDLLIASTSNGTLEAFLRRSPFVVPPANVDGTWIVQLPGWGTRQ